MSGIQSVNAEDKNDSSEGNPHVNTCYFSRSALNLFILTPPNARHTQYALSHSRVAVNVFNTNHKVGDPISGLQLETEFSALDYDQSIATFNNYCARHPQLKKHVPDYNFVLENLESRFFRIGILGGQIVSEPRLGSENYIKFSVAR